MAKAKPAKEKVETITTPGMLAEKLEVDAKRIRAFLRQTFTRPNESKNSSWHLTQEQVEAVEARFTPAADAE